MDAEIVKSDLAQVSVESGIEENGIVHQEIGLREPITFGSHGVDEPVNLQGISASVANFPKDAVDEWPEPKQFHSFYFVKYRSYEDLELKGELEKAEKVLQGKNQARFQLIEEIKAKRLDRGQLIAQMKPLNAENKLYWSIIDEKRKEMEPLQQALGKLRSSKSNSVNREKGVGICSSEEELNHVIKGLHYKISHESNTLSEEKQFLREIKLLEGSREKVIANDAMKAKIQDSLGEKDVIQDQVKLMGVDLDGVRKEQKAVQDKLKQLTEERVAIEEKMEKLETKVQTLTAERETAYEQLKKLKNQREEGNMCFYQNRTLLTKVRELAAKKDIEALKEISNIEVEKFMSQWNKQKNVREDYEKRILPSLDIRQLSRDGRMRNPDEKPLVFQEAPISSETEMVTKTKVKRSKEDTIPSPADASLVEDVPKEAKAKTQKESKNKLTSSGATAVEPIVELEDKGGSSLSEKPQKDLESKLSAVVVDEAKLKEMRREEEIAKAKLALERKKKLAEKAAAKAAIKAQKEAEKKLKEREKKAKKKAASSAPEPEEQPTEVDDADAAAETEKADENGFEALPVLSKNSKDRKENAIRYRNRAKGPDSIPRPLLKRKKSTNYWVWAAAPAAVVSVMMVIVVGYKYFL